MIIWVQYRKGPMQPVREVANSGLATRWLDHIAASWCATKRGRKARRMGNERFLYYSDGKLAGTVFVDPLPAREPVQPRKAKGANA